MRPSRRIFLKRAAALGAVPLAFAGYGHGCELHWLDVHDVPIALPNLCKDFEGFRIAHLTDLHASDSVSPDYLRRVIERVNAIKPDLTVITGDFTTHKIKWLSPICQIISKLQSPAIASLGNHDYDECTAYPGVSTRIADMLQERLAKLGIPLLRNFSHQIQRGQSKMTFVGLDDIHSGLFDPQRGFNNVSSEDAVITLSHNPDSVPFLSTYPAGLILAGHTHGGQVRVPFLGAPILPVANRQWDEGYFRVGQNQLYVSRGVGHLMAIRFCCRPELPVYVLRRA